jgi:3-oxoacyl-(acyl-carrier-protein) synthase
MTSDALGLWAIDAAGHGLERAMALALQDAGAEPRQVRTTWSSGCGAADADSAEDDAVRRLLPRARVRRPKQVLGDCLGVGGALGVVLATRSWPSEKGPVALVNSVSTGGTNVSLALGRPGRRGRDAHGA